MREMAGRERGSGAGFRGRPARSTSPGERTLAQVSIAVLLERPRFDVIHWRVMATARALESR